MVELPISTDDEFHKIMDGLDGALQARGEQIFGRELRLMMGFCKKLGISVASHVAHAHPAEPGVYTIFNFGNHILSWTERRYGSRLGVDPAWGYFAIYLRGDAWLVKVPMIAGKVQLVIDRDINKRFPPHVLNLVTLIEDLTPSLAAELTDIEVLLTHRLFVVHFDMHNWFVRGQTPPQSLAGIALRDLMTGARRVTSSRWELGAARWDALQASEKFLKHYITERGGSFRKVHNIGALLEAAENLGFVAAFGNVEAAVQCGAGVRYESNPHTLPETVVALEAAAYIGRAVAVQLHSKRQ